MKELSYIKYPPTIKILIQELKKATDDYIARKINGDELKQIIWVWADNAGDKMFNGSSEFNPTVEQRVGAKRLNLVKHMLVGYQYKMF